MERERKCSICGRGALTRESRLTEYRTLSGRVIVNVIADWCDLCGEGLLSLTDIKHIQAQLEGRRDIGAYGEGEEEMSEYKVSLVVQWLIDQLEYVNSKIEKGKGTWPEEGYVRDDDWARLMGQKDVLDSILYVFKQQGLVRD